MHDTKVITLLFALLSLQPNFAAADAECLPGWGAKVERLRAAQRAHGCSGAASMSECKALMGLGAAGIATAAGARGAAASRRAALAVRDAEFHPCPLPSRTSAHYRILGLMVMDSAWAACTSSLDIHRSSIVSSIDTLTGEVDNAIASARTSLKAMEDLEKELAGLSPAERAKKIAAVGEQSAKGYNEEQKKLIKAHDLERTNLGYSRHSNEMFEAGDLKSAKMREFKTLFNRHFGRPFNQELDFNLDLQTMSERLPAHEQARFNAVRKELYDASVAEILAKRKLEAIDRDPKVSALSRKVAVLNGDIVDIRQLARNPETYPAELSKRTAVLRENLATLEKSKEALIDFGKAAKAAKSSGDLITIAERLHNFVPKQFLAESGMKVFSSVLANMRAAVEGLIQIEGKMTDISHDLLRKWTAHLPKAGAGLRTTASLAAKGIAFVGGSFVSLATFASNEFSGGCPGTPSSANFPANPDKGCSRDFSFDNPQAAKLAAMDSKDLCELAKSNPATAAEIDQMIAVNYDRYYPGVRGQCGNPLKLSSSRWGNLTYDGKETQFTPIGETRPVSISYDERGNETAIRLPKYIRSGGTEKIDWGDSAPIGYGDRHEKSTAIYRDMVRPLLAEASACCSSGGGVSPPAADCARWGLIDSGGSTPLRGGPTTR